ncbi:MAG: CRISPR-associated endoribonuclease Cas6 [Lachnospiraceae bacterium]|nr:CRISPR-associated endoribonuclease Cas6 [Lachnospiraceae bacterium]
MLSKLELQIEYAHREKLSYQISSAMHGILMEYVDPEYAGRLHENGRKPFHQYVTDMTEHSFTWTVCTLNQEAREQIIDRLMKQKSFLMKHKELELVVKGQRMQSTSYENLVQEYYFRKQPRDITLRFLTPTSFRQKGSYVFIPDVRLIFQSLMDKYDAFSRETSVSSPEVLEHLEQYAYIKKYRLNSVRFSLEGVKISGFLGECTIHINGPEPLCNLANMLAAFGEYGGIGIKSALGMGAVQIRTGDRNKEQNFTDGATV